MLARRLPVGWRGNRSEGPIGGTAPQSIEDRRHLVTIGRAYRDICVEIVGGRNSRRVQFQEWSRASRSAIHVVGERRISCCRGTCLPRDLHGALANRWRRVHRDAECKRYGYSFHLCSFHARDSRAALPRAIFGAYENPSDACGRGAEKIPVDFLTRSKLSM